MRARIAVAMMAVALGGCALPGLPGEAGPERAHRALSASGALYADTRWRSAVRGTGRGLLTPADRGEYRFGVLDSPAVNAMALPGGGVYVTRGLLARLDCADELAAVLAHEIAHVRVGHARVRDAALSGVGALVGAYYGEAAGLAARVLSVLGTAAYSRDDERDADGAAAARLAASGRDPAAMIALLEALRPRPSAEREAGWLDTHPAPSARIRALRRARPGLGGASVCPREARRAYFQRLDGLPLGPRQGRGRAVGGTYYHAGLDIALPLRGGWRVATTQPTLIATHRPSGSRAVLYRIDAPAQADALAVLRAAGFRRLTVRQRPEQPGFSGGVVVADARHPLRDDAPVRVRYAHTGEQAVVVISAHARGHRPPPDPGRAMRAGLSEAERLAAGAVVVRTRRLEVPTTLAALATTTPVSAARLARLNGLVADTPLKAGRWVKTLHPPRVRAPAAPSSNEAGPARSPRGDARARSYR